MCFFMFLVIFHFSDKFLTLLIHNNKNFNTKWYFVTRSSGSLESFPSYVKIFKFFMELITYFKTSIVQNCAKFSVANICFLWVNKNHMWLEDSSWASYKIYFQFFGRFIFTFILFLFFVFITICIFR